MHGFRLVPLPRASYTLLPSPLQWPSTHAPKPSSDGPSSWLPNRGSFPSVPPLLDSQALLFLNTKILCQARVLLHCFFLSVSLQGYSITSPLGSPVLDTLLQLLPPPHLMTSSPGPTHTSTFPRLTLLYCFFSPFSHILILIYFWFFSL